MINNKENRILVETQGYDCEKGYILISQINGIFLYSDEYINGVVSPCLFIKIIGDRNVIYLTQKSSIEINEKFNLNFDEIKTLILK